MKNTSLMDIAIVIAILSVCILCTIGILTDKKESPKTVQIETILQKTGEISRVIGDEFKKGYHKKDSVSVDSLDVK